MASLLTLKITLIMWRPQHRSQSLPAADGSATLADLGPGQRALVQGIGGADSALRRRLLALGVVRGAEIVVDFIAPLGDPRAYTLLGYRLTLRNDDARAVLVQPA
jgi:ferrous iron transport protein A